MKCQTFSFDKILNDFLSFKLRNLVIAMRCIKSYLKVENKCHSQVDVDRLIFGQLGQHVDNFIQKLQKFVQEQELFGSGPCDN